jgi:hypothetical protein
MWPILESIICIIALVSNLQVLKLYGFLPSAHALSLLLSLLSDPLSMDLLLLKELHLSDMGQSILTTLQSLNHSENVQDFDFVTPKIPPL